MSRGTAGVPEGVLLESNGISPDLTPSGLKTLAAPAFKGRRSHEICQHLTTGGAIIILVSGVRVPPPLPRVSPLQLPGYWLFAGGFCKVPVASGTARPSGVELGSNGSSRTVPSVICIVLMPDSAS